jgi:hypothetical protein
VQAVVPDFPGLAEAQKCIYCPYGQILIDYGAFATTAINM